MQTTRARALVVLSILVFLSSRARAVEPGDQLFKLTADDAAARDLFGGATPADTDDRTTDGVALDGTTAIVGAPAKNTAAGEKAGAAYVYDVSAGQQLTSLAANDAGPGATFGSAVDIRGNLAVVGAAHNVAGTSTPGSAYLFDIATGTQLRQLVPDDPVEFFDGFGWSAEIDGQIAIIGAPLHPSQGESLGGSAYLFDTRTGQQLSKLVPAEPRLENNDWFGVSVSISGNSAIVGAWGDNEFGDFAGAAYLFDVTTGQQRLKLTAPDAEAFEEFGQSVSIHGNLAVVGAPSADNENGDFSGMAYVFDVSTGQHLLTLVSDDSEPDDRFGWSVAIDDRSIVVGATGDRDGGPFSGSAYVFDADTGQQQLKLIATDAAQHDQFGWAVSLDRDVVLVAAPFDDDACPNDPECQSGAAYLFALVPPQLMAGDANQDLSFDQLDIVQVAQRAKYLTGQTATWGQGDWNGAPGGAVGDPPGGDGLFNQLDIVASLAGGTYLTGPYAGLRANERDGDGQTSLVYDAGTGELTVDAPVGGQLTSINIDSAAGIFTGDAAQSLGGSFDHDADDNIFKATFGGSFGTLSFGHVAQPGLDRDFLLQDLTVVGSLAGGGALGDVDLIYVPVPEPASAVLLALGAIGLATTGRRRP